MTNEEQLTINTLRVLSSEAIEKAKSGHPGICLGAAPMAYALFSRHLKHNPKNPNFFDRDRFVLSAGHGSALLYSLLHIFGYGLTKEDMMRFRQHTSKTPGHPEYGVTAGVEVSTGPLGRLRSAFSPTNSINPIARLSTIIHTRFAATDV